MNSFSNQSKNDDEEVETVTIKKKKITKSKKINNFQDPSSINNSKIKKSTWKGDSFDEGDDEERKKNKILNMIKNAHVEKFKNYVLLKEVNNAHDEVQRYIGEGDFASAKMMETELNDLHSSVIYSNINPITKSRLGKSAYYKNPYSSFNKSVYNTNKQNYYTMKTDERKIFEKSTRVKHRNAEKIEEEMNEEEEEEIEEETQIKNKKRKNKNKNKNKNNTLNNLNEQKDKNNNNRLGSDNNNFGSDNNELGSEINNFGKDSNNLGRDNNRLGSKINNLGSDNNNFGQDSNNLGSDNNRLGSENNNYGKDSNNLGSDNNNLGSDNNNLGKDSNKLGSDNNNLGSDNNRLGS